MGFLLGGSSTYSQHPLLQYGHSPSSSHSTSVLLFAHNQVAMKKKKRKATKTIVMAHPEEESQKNESCLQRRAVLFVGISAFPLLQKFRAIAAEAAAKGELVVFRHGERNRRLMGGNQRADDGGGLIASFRNGETELMQTAIQAPQIADSSPQVADNSPKIVDTNSVSSLEQKQSKKPVRLEEAPENLFISLLNAVGIFGSGVLGALYAISQKDKAAIESTVDSLKSMLDDKEASIALLEKNFEERMSNEEGEHKKQIKKLKEEEYALSNHLASANVTITSLGQELQSEKWLVEDLKVRLDQVQNCLLQANEEKKVLERKIKDKMEDIDFLQDRVNLLGFEIKDKEKHIEALNTSLCVKELECKNLNSSLDQTKSDHKNASSAVEQLTTEILQIKEELDSKKCLIDELIAKLQSSSAEKDDINKKFCTLQNDYNNLELTSAKKADLDSELLSKKNDEIQQLQQKLGHALDEAKKHHALVSSLNKEKDSFKAMLEEEMNKVTNLQNELHATQQSSKDSKLEASNLTSQLGETETKCKQLEAECLRIQKDFSETKKLLTSSLDEAKSATMLLSDELASVRGALDGTRQELFLTSDELKTALEAHESLQKELLEIYQKAETAAHDLKEERQLVATLKEELDASEKQVIRESETRKALESDLCEAKKSLDELNERSMSLSRELESANSRAAGLEEEKELIYKTLTEQRSIAKEAQENIEDAQNLIVRLGTERESLQKRAKKLEGELATAKGEILRLRRSSLSKESVNEHNKNVNEIEATSSVVTRKSSGRRKRGGNTEESSQQ